uniref:Essential meiotic structure-specific endonuclease subunit 2 n=1 Tax=Sphenodon punctatus TaxID=8508 RepID=A0A8D0H956_SPHPU
MTVCMDPGLLEDRGSDALMEALGSMECKYCITPQILPCSITWKRNMPDSLSVTDGSPLKAEEEDEVLVLVEPWDFLKRLFSLMQSGSNVPLWSGPDLTQILPLNCLEGDSTKAYSLVVIGLDAYQWYNQHQERQQVLIPEDQGRREDPSPQLSVTQQEIEEALVMLQLWGNTGVLFLDTWQEFSQHVSVMTKAIAKRPYKKQLGTLPFSFCTDGGWSSGVRVEKDGTGLREAWRKQLQQFNRVSCAMAEAIAAAYPSPSLLLQAYEKCSTKKERLLLLSDIQVKTEENGKERQIGPDLSRRVYLCMASTNPDLVLDISA